MSLPSIHQDVPVRNDTIWRHRRSPSCTHHTVFPSCFACVVCCCGLSVRHRGGQRSGPKPEASALFQPSRLNLTRASETKRRTHSTRNLMSQYGNPYARPTNAPKPAEPQFGKCAGCGGGRFLWKPTSGKYVGQSLIACCLPFDQRQGACRQYEPYNGQTGHPAPVNDGSYPGGWSSVPAGYSQVPQPLGTPLVPEPPTQNPSFEQALHAWCEQMHEMGAMLAENIRLLTALQPKPAQ